MCACRQWVLLITFMIVIITIAMAACQREAGSAKSTEPLLTLGNTRLRRLCRLIKMRLYQEMSCTLQESVTFLFLVCIIDSIIVERAGS
jgi:hypothetical protein